MAADETISTPVIVDVAVSSAPISLKFFPISVNLGSLDCEGGGGGDGGGGSTRPTSGMLYPRGQG